MLCGVLGRFFRLGADGFSRPRQRTMAGAHFFVRFLYDPQSFASSLAGLSEGAALVPGHPRDARVLARLENRLGSDGQAKVLAAVLWEASWTPNVGQPEPLFKV